MSPLLLFSVCWLGLATAWSAQPIDLELAEFHFERFIQQYGRQYADEDEKQARFQIFKENLKKINEKNKNSDSAVYDINQFSDLTTQEFLRYHTGLITPANWRKTNTLTDQDIPYANAPDSFDWRDQNVVTPVKNQWRCGSCYAFSATGNIESQYAIKYKQQILISEQQIVDCDTLDQGCEKGGLPWNAFKSLIAEGGAMGEEDYPYRGVTGHCQFEASKVKIKLSDSHVYSLQSQEKVKQLLFQNGPLSIGVDGEGVYNYNRGIIKDEECNGTVTHAVLLVGYGTDAGSGEQYWIVKNSWGTTYGDEGYLKMHRGEGAISCGMMAAPISTAVVA